MNQIWCAIADPRSTLTLQISSECVHCQLSVAKNHNFGKILIFGLLYPTPFYRWGPNLVCYSRLAVYAYAPNFVSICSFCRALAAKNQFLPYFATFWTSAFSVVANWQQSKKVEHGCTTTNFPLSNGIKIVSVVQRLHGESGAQALTFKSVTDRQTNTQTNKKNSPFLAAPAAGEIRAPPNLAWW